MGGKKNAFGILKRLLSKGPKGRMPSDGAQAAATQDAAAVGAAAGAAAGAAVGAAAGAAAGAVVGAFGAALGAAAGAVEAELDDDNDDDDGTVGGAKISHRHAPTAAAGVWSHTRTKSLYATAGGASQDARLISSR
jgi:phage tail tape-measure protein